MSLGRRRAAYNRRADPSGESQPSCLPGGKEEGDRSMPEVRLKFSDLIADAGAGRGGTGGRVGRGDLVRRRLFLIDAAAEIGPVGAVIARRLLGDALRPPEIIVLGVVEANRKTAAPCRGLELMIAVVIAHRLAVEERQHAMHDAAGIRLLPRGLV